MKSVGTEALSLSFCAVQKLDTLCIKKQGLLVQHWLLNTDVKTFNENGKLFHLNSSCARWRSEQQQKTQEMCHRPNTFVLHCSFPQNSPWHIFYCRKLLDVLWNSKGHIFFTLLIAAPRGLKESPHKQSTHNISFYKYEANKTDLLWVWTLWNWVCKGANKSIETVLLNAPSSSPKKCDILELIIARKLHRKVYFNPNFLKSFFLIWSLTG